VKAIILAAGSGLRLSGASGGLPKCLLPVAGQSLIEHQLRCIRRFGIQDIVVVVGFKARQVRGTCGAGIRFIENPIFDRTNSLYSLWLARKELAGGFLVMNSDVLFHPALLSRLLRSDREDALLVALHDGNMPPFGEEEMKAKLDGDKLVDISKSMPVGEAHGENVGIAKFGTEGASLFVDLMNALIHNGRYQEWVPRVFQEFVTHRPLYTVDTDGYPWIEIDFPEDYHRAITEIFPMFSRYSAPERSSITERARFG